MATHSIFELDGHYVIASHAWFQADVIDDLLICLEGTLWKMNLLPSKLEIIVSTEDLLLNDASHIRDITWTT